MVPAQHVAILRVGGASVGAHRGEHLDKGGRRDLGVVPGAREPGGERAARVLEVREPDVDHPREQAHGLGRLVSARVAHDGDGEARRTRAQAASTTCGAKWPGVTRLMLRAPWPCSSSIIWARRATVTSWPKLPLLISAFWQKTQRRVHDEKKMAPDPASPEMGGSSQKCSAARATRRAAVAPQAPRAPAARAAPQARGHSSQRSYSLGAGAVMGPHANTVSPAASLAESGEAGPPCFTSSMVASPAGQRRGPACGAGRDVSITQRADHSVARRHFLVETKGIEPSASAMRRQRSPAELRPQARLRVGNCTVPRARVNRELLGQGERERSAPVVSPQHKILGKRLYRYPLIALIAIFLGFCG